MDESLAAREAWNVVLFILGFAMGGTFLTFLIRKFRTLDWYDDGAAPLAVALCLFAFGGGVRGGYVSVLLHCQNIGGDCSFIEHNSWVMHLAGVMIVAGGLYTLRTLSPPDWWPWSWVCTAIVVILLPVVYYTMARWQPFNAGVLIHGAHEWKLVVLSVVVAIVSSYTALDLAGYTYSTLSRASILWVVVAAIALGGGIWSMHFIAMLSFTLPGVPISYDFELTVLSLLLPIFVCMAGFFIVAQERATPSLLWLSGSLIGCGIVAMHYVGMAAMEMSAVMEFDRLLVAASILIAVGASVVAVWIAFGRGRVGLTFKWKLGAAIIEGIAIAGMHYTAMAAASFRVYPSVRIGSVARTIDSGQLAASVAAITFAILLTALAVALFNQRRLER